MSAIDTLLANNAEYAAAFDNGDLPLPPALKVAVVACMDARLNVFAALGLQVGDAHVIRNAGGVVTDDAIRSLAISQRLLGTEEIILIHHTGCGMLTFTDDEFKRSINDEVGTAPEWAAEAFDDLDEDVRQSIARIRASPFVPHRDHVRGFVYDVNTGALREVPDRSRQWRDVAHTGTAPLTLNRIEYTDVVAATNRRLRFGPPNTRLAATSGSLILPISVPSGSRQCTPSHAAAQTRPVSSRRKPSNVPFVHVGEDLAAGQLAVGATSKRRMWRARVSTM